MKRLLFVLSFIVALYSSSVYAVGSDGRSESVVTILGESYYVHTVQPKETLYGLSKLYNVSEDDIRRNNPQTAEGLRSGQVLKIPIKGGANSANKSVEDMTPRQIKRNFTTHVVNQGETGYSISKRYGISLNTLIEDNKGFDPAHLSIGQVLNIRKDSQGKTSPEEIDQQMTEYKDALNSLSDSFEHHVVAQGETLYSLSKKYDVPIETIQNYNRSALQDGLKMGSIIRIPVKKEGSMSAITQQPNTSDNSSTVADQSDPLRPSDWDEFYLDSNENIPVKNINIEAPVKLVVMLPVRVNGINNRQFVEFYQGILMALEELKPMGVSTKIDLFNTARSEAEVRELLKTREVQDADIIIGPVYDEMFSPVADFARSKGIPVVSPLAAIKKADNSLLFQVAPAESTKNDKLRNVIAGDKNVIVVSSSADDAEFTTEMSSLVPNPTHRISYNKDNFAGQIEKCLNNDKENIIVVLARNENIVDAILARISSVQNNIVARSMGTPVIKVIGSSRWSRFQNIDQRLLFKLNLMYVTSYHADRGNERVAAFDKKYMKVFSTFPSLYSYRGYDEAKLFVCNIKLHGSEFADYLNDGSVKLLQTPYLFKQERPGGKFVNQDWALVCYQSNFTIEVK